MTIQLENLPQGIITKKDNGILWVIINRGKANAIDATHSQLMTEIFNDFEKDQSLRVAILSSTGKRFFCAGWDLKSASEGETADTDFGQYGFGGLATRFNATKPVIAAVNGMAIGGGFEIALSCDLIISSENGKFSLPEPRVGVAPDTGSLRLGQRLPYFIAMEMLLTSKTFTANELAQHGLINKVVDDALLLKEAQVMAEEIIKGAPLSISAIKELVNASLQNSLEDNHKSLIDKKFPKYESMLNSKDAIEGPLSFVEKRTPKWTGR